MRKKERMPKFASLLAITALTVGIIASSGVISNASKAIDIERISGKDRYETSAKIAKKYKADSVIVVSGKTFADSLSANALARQESASILLTDGKNITDIEKELIRDSKKV